MTVLAWSLLADAVCLSVPRIVTSDHAHRARVAAADRARRVARWARLSVAAYLMEVSS